MKGRTQETRKKAKSKGKNPSVSVSEAVKQEAADASVSDLPPDQTIHTSPLRTSRRTQQHAGQALEVYLTSTPVHKASADVTEGSPPVKQTTPKYSRRIASQKTLEETSSSPKCVRVLRNGCKTGRTSCPRKVKKGMSQDQKKPSSRKSSPPSKLRCNRKRKLNTDVSNKCLTSEAPQRSRPRFELDEQSPTEHGETLMSSDLSIELSPYEEKLPSLSQQEEEEEEESEEEEELPSFLQVDKKPPSITQGAFVWYKLRSFPYWPALVKRLNHKQKKANIIFIDNSIFEKKKGFAVPLRSLKPFDCEEADEMINKGKEEYGSVISWVLELINDYRIRIACGSFSGSFIEYFVHDISHPVRRTYPQEATGSLAITSEAILLENVSDGDSEDEISPEQQEEDTGRAKRLLPDRTHAAHNRANEKLVHFIVKQRMVEERLLGVIHGQQQSRWLHDYRNSDRQRIIKVYLEDQKQLDSVYSYLSELHAKAAPAASSVVKVLPLDHVTFVLDVLLPEAIIYAIAGVDNVSLEKAEEKYLKGRQRSKRERQEFEKDIERLWMKSQIRSATAHSLSSSVMNESKGVLL